MSERLQEYAKRLKLSHLRANYMNFTPEQVTFLERIFEEEIEQRETSRINLLLKQANLPKCGNEPYVWQHVQLPKTITSEEIVSGQFIAERENLILYGGVGVGKTYLSRLIALNALIVLAIKYAFIRWLV